jgi:hypothetical protein
LIYKVEEGGRSSEDSSRNPSQLDLWTYGQHPGARKVG